MRKPEDLPKLLASRKITYPLLYDPEETYLKSLGMAAFPIATLLNADGKVVWQAETGHATFSAACEAEIKKLLRANPPKEAGPEEAPR